MHQTTIVHWAFLWDFLIIYTFLMCSQPWSSEKRKAGLAALLAWMFVSKFIKLIGHYVRYPVDFLLLPVSIVFGYLHGLIKAKAMLSLNVVSYPALGLLLSRPNDGRTRRSCIRYWIEADVRPNMTDCLGHQRWCRRRRCLSDDPSQSEAAGGGPAGKFTSSTAGPFQDERKLQVLTGRHGSHDASIEVLPGTTAHYNTLHVRF